MALKHLLTVRVQVASPRREREQSSVGIVHGTQRFRDRVSGVPAGPNDRSAALLGSWYATLLRWRPGVALFVDEPTLLPLLIAVTPARTLLNRLPDAAAELLTGHLVHGS